MRQQAERRAAGFIRQQARRAPRAGQQRGGVAGQAQARAAAVGGDVDGAESGEDLVVGTFVLQHLLEGGEKFVAAQAREGQGPPGDAQLDAEGGLVGAVAADVADHGVDGAVRGADGVVDRGGAIEYCQRILSWTVGKLECWNEQHHSNRPTVQHSNFHAPTAAGSATRRPMASAIIRTSRISCMN